MTAAMSAIISTPSGDCGYYRIFGAPSEGDQYNEDVIALYALCAYDGHRCVHERFDDFSQRSSVVTLLKSSPYLRVTRIDVEYAQLLGNIFLFCSNVEEADALCDIFMEDVEAYDKASKLHTMVVSMNHIEDKLRHLDHEINNPESILHKDIAIEIRAEFLKSSVPEEEEMSP